MKAKYIIPILLTTIIFAGCKTTEKNYRSAYDVAIQKKAREDSLLADRRAEMGLGNLIVEDDPDGAKITRIADRDVRALHISIAKADSVHRYAPAVAAFKMPANASAYATDLRNEGWTNARTAKSAERYFVILGSTDNGPEALTLLDSFISANPDRPSVGLSSPLIIITPTYR